MKIKLLFIAFSIGLIGHEFIQMLLDAKHQFISIFLVVILDFVFGVLKAFKLGNFETRKTFKAVYILTGFWLLLATVLQIEKGFPFADFLSEAILLPIILFQLISTLKNMNILGLIDSDLLNRLLSKIDKHKD